MAADPYATLGVAKTATDAEIKTAYRKLAKKNHPDLNPGDAGAKQRFADISAANDLLSDKDKRAAFDRGEIDAGGQPRQQQQFYRDYAGAGMGGAGGGMGGQRYRASAGAAPGGFESSAFSDIFESMFGGGRGQQVSSDAHYSIEIDFLEAAKGASRRVTMPDGAALDITIPAGVAEGQQLRLKGKGHAGKGGKAGDAYVELHIKPHELFTRDGNNITIELAVAFHESILGSRVAVPTIHGPVNMAIPKGASTGRLLRLKGKGVKDGDQFVRLKIVMPHTIDPELETFTEEWAKTHSFDPRGKPK